jgi:energy-coupling factor transporter transmembrane protein EcfT
VVKRGPASSLAPGCKLLCLALISSAIFFSRPALTGFLALAAAALLRIEGIGFGALLQESAFVALFAAFSALLRFFGPTEEPLALLEASAVYGLRLLAAFLAGRLFYSSTRPSELRDSLTRITRRLRPLRGFDLGLGLSMIIGFIPLIFEEWASSREAARSRGLARRPRLSMQTIFMTAILRRLMLRAIATPEALVTRGWTIDRGLYKARWRSKDILASLSCSLVFVLSALRLV